MQSLDDIDYYVDEIVDELKFIDKKEIQIFLNDAIYRAVEEQSLTPYFDGKIEKPKENVEESKQQEIFRLPLNEQQQANMDDEIKEQLQNLIMTEDEFIDYLLETYETLQEMRPQVISYVNSFKTEPVIIQDSFNLKEKLVKINDFNKKQKIIEWLKKNEKLPSNLICKKNFGLDLGQLDNFQKCFQQQKVISFEEDELLPEEIEAMYIIFKGEKNLQKVSEQILIDIKLVEKFFILWTSQLKQETELLNLMVTFGRSSEISVYVELILNENKDELFKVLLLIYKKSKKDYQKASNILHKYIFQFENWKLEKLIRLSRDEDLKTNSEKQNQVIELLNHFLENDIIIYLMILHELWVKEENQKESKYLEQVIIQEKHQNMISAVAQLLILDAKPQLKAEVAEKRFFIDYNNEQNQIEKHLMKQLQNSIKSDKNQKQFVQFGWMPRKQEFESNELVDTIQKLAEITNKYIKIHLMSQLDQQKTYSPEKKMDQSTLLLVRDEQNKVFNIMVEYENEKKQIDYSQLQELKQKLVFLNNHLPLWLDSFVQLPSLRRVLLGSQDDQTPGEEKPAIKLLQTISKTQNDFLQFKTNKYKKELFKIATQLWNLDNQLLQEWFLQQEKNEKMKNFCDYMIAESARQNSYWAFNQVSHLQKYFPMDSLKMTLKDFNRVQKRSELNQRKETIFKLKDSPKQLAKYIINTIFGFILRKDDLSVIQSELQSVVEGSPISLRFLISYLIQSSDMGLRARLSYYLSQNKAVPLIMNCQETYKDLNFNMNYNQELIFSMEQVEGVGVFSFGIGKMATYPCGKSEISNMIVTPKFDNKSFDTNDINVLSNGQIDLFLEKCYQKKNGWAYMDGQGEIPKKNLQSILPLTNIIIIHFFEQDKNDKASIEKLEENIKTIKQNDNEILICVILRDCPMTKEFTKSNYPDWLPIKDQIDKVIALIDLNQDNKINKLIEIEKILLYFNTKVREIRNLNSNKSKLKCKFTKENFLNQFCQSDEKGEATFQRISEILQLSSDFLQQVQKLNQTVFDAEGLPSLKLKDEIREINLKLRSFSVQEEEDQDSAAKRENQLLAQVKSLNIKLQELEMNTLMQNFWHIINHKDAVLIKIQISKGLADFTSKKTMHLVIKKNKLLKEDGIDTNKKQDGFTYKEIQDANNKFQEEIKKVDEEIFESSLSYEYFWRSLICFITDSKKCTFWQNEMDKLNFTQAIRQQMLEGDTFELVDGRNLEMKGDIIRQILGNEIECAKCIVACVIGPQSTGKSTLMNFCFGTQFLASTGRCTQGIYFTLQRIPTELKKGKDVEYLIILDTEGLNSPERAEPEYDRKIVIFTLLCSDFLIINSKGDMNYQMKELIKICTVRYDQLRGNAKVPKILYTFVQNNDTNPASFIAQISSLKSDVIECSTTQTVKKTTDELMTVHDNLVKVMGSAYIQKLIEKDDSKGLIEQNQINICEDIFGVHCSKVWLEVQNLFVQKDYQFRQIGTWLTVAQDHWSLIERHGAKLIEHANVIAMKNDTKMKEYFTKLWNEYLNTGVTAKDNQKAKENSQSIFESFLAGNELNEEKNKFIKANNEEKSKDYEQMWFLFEKWKQEPSQKYLTHDLETKYNLELKKKMDVLKDSFKLLLENKLKEIQMMQIHNNGISDLFQKARLLSSTFKQENQEDIKEKIIDEAFQNAWDQIMIQLSGQEQIDKLMQTSCEYLSSTFRNVNSFMSNIKPQEYNRILAAAKSEDMLKNQDLPKQLVEYLVAHISKNAFQNSKGEVDHKDQFKFDPQMIGLLKDPSERIFCEKEKDKYLPLKKLLKVNYKYKIIKDMVYSLNNSTIYELIKKELNQVKQKETEYFSVNLFGNEFRYTRIIEEDDKQRIIEEISSFFQELGQAGFGFKQEAKQIYGIDSQNGGEFILLDQIDVEEELNRNAIFGNSQNKQKWVEDLKQRITWQEQEKINISSRLEQILNYSYVQFENQMHPKVKFEQHMAQEKQIQDAMWRSNKPELSYVFCDDNTKGKINFKQILKDKKQILNDESYFQCLVNPVKYDLAESQKWHYLSNLTAMLIDWEKIVLTINQRVSTEIIKVKQKSLKELQLQNINLIDTEFDLKNVLERNQITLEQAERIQIHQLQGIKQELDDELHSKLALYVHQTLSGVITWVACIIIWYKSQKNILTKFNEQQMKLESQKDTYKKNFRDIALGMTATVTIQGASQIFNEAFKGFNDNCKNNIIVNIRQALKSKEVLEKFETDNVYSEMDKKYISLVSIDEYQNCISYVMDPVKSFESYVDSISKVLVKNLEQKQIRLYQEKVQANFNNLKKRLDFVNNICKNNEQWDESVNLFEIQRVGKAVPLVYQEKKKIEPELSSIYLNTIKSILEGTYKIEPQEITLKINQIETKFIFTTKSKDSQQKEFGNPLKDLQQLKFEEDTNDEFIQIFLKRLEQKEKNFGLCSDIRVMIENLILLIDSKILEIESLSLNDIYDINQQIKSLKNNAIGCRTLCKFCNRKCEHKPHNDNKGEGTPHSCEKRGHQLRVFAGGSLEISWGAKYPSLSTCDEILPSTHVEITNDKQTEYMIWSDVHDAKNRNWITNYIKYKNDDQINPFWSQMNLQWTNFWKVLGNRFCEEYNYKFILAEEQLQLNQNQNQGFNEKSIVILCLDDSDSMFKNQKDFNQAVQGGKEVEKYLKINHKNQNQVHIQLWYNDCIGVTQAYKGQLSGQIPDKAWIRQPCQSDNEIRGILPASFNYGNCGQFQGAIRILTQEVNNLLDKDPSYERVYWFMFSDGDNDYPANELAKLKNLIKDNPEKWTDSTGKNSKLIPLIITNQPEVKSLNKMSNKLNYISRDIWRVDNFCSLRQDVKIDKLAVTMIEKFTIN